ncbi:hypothetical protein [uncultured Erythrobacter sp.]|uniref:hypothetical protein n=1 Tax=uncultured Erythrobacter sp. TaxID=263913 RepID=UPI0026238CDE|nr:hypothetical protein [uncultured Erythrobacter sp.]
MHLFEIIVVLHVIAGTTGLIAFWVPILTKKGAKNHRRWGRICCYGFMAAGALAIAMAMFSLYGPEERIPSVTDRVLFDGLFGWMMLYLGLLTIGFADYGLAVVKHSRKREALRAPRYQLLIAAVLISAAYCFYYGFGIGELLMMAVALLGLAAMIIQQLYIWRKEAPTPQSYVGEHFRALIGMGISAYTAFMSVGLIRYIPEHVFNPLVWALPSAVGVALIIGFSLQAKRKTTPKSSKAAKPQPSKTRPTSA